MSRTNWQDPGSGEIISPHVSGLQEAVGKIEDAIRMKTKVLTGVALSEVYIADTDRYRIYQAPASSRNWVSSPAPVIKKNAAVISTGFEIDYGGGAVIFNPPILGTDVITADVTVLDNQSSAFVPFVLKSVVYDSVNNKIVCTIGPGRGRFNAGLVTKTADSTYDIAAPAINTTYYVYLKSDGTFTHNTTGIFIAGHILLHQIATGSVVSTITTTDVRGEIPEVPGYTPVNKAGDTMTGLLTRALGALGTTAGNTLDLDRMYGVEGNIVNLIIRLRRTATGTGWNTTAIDLLRRTDSTDQANITLHPDGNVQINGQVAWHAGNDGVGSGLDADLLDGLQASAFATLSGAAFTGQILTRGSTGGVSKSGTGSEALEVLNVEGAANAAIISLHRRNAYAVNFGLDTDNKLKVGGWSMGAVAHEIWHAGNYNHGRLVAPPIVVSGSAVTSVQFTALDGNAHGGYVLVAEINSAVASEVFLNYNNDQNAGNYEIQSSLVDGGSHNMARGLNVYRIVTLNGGSRELVIIDTNISPDGHMMSIARNARHNANGICIETVTHKYKTAVTNLTQLDIRAATAGAIGVGSKFSLYRRA